MLIKLSFDNKSTILIDHTQIIVEIQYESSGNKELWYGGIYIRDGIEDREEPLSNVRGGAFLLSDRKLLDKQKFSNLKDAETYIAKVQEYVNTQLNSNKNDSIEEIASILQSLNDANDSTHKLLHNFINKQATSLDKLVELMTPVPKATKAVKSKKKEEPSHGLES